MKFWVRLMMAWLMMALLVALPGPVLNGQASSQPQAEAAREKAKAMLLKLTAEERVGQLFLVTFPGSTFDENSQIFDLIANHHIGGVILLRANDNFSTVDNLPEQAYSLNRLLQDSEAKASQRRITKPNTGTSFAPQYIPLLIGVSQEGDSYPNDQILNGLTALPDLMTIGATWNPALATQVGSVMGAELSALGFNLILGPALDVIDTPQTEGGEDLGVRTFGGDPYWVGKMGQAYISGLHEGSNNRLAVVAKHFPGRGSSDRSSEEEIATVRKSLEQLKQIELAPFFSVTGTASNIDMVADGLLVSHIRYQGFQGNIRATTRPVSSDAAALDQILKLQPFSQWRDNGGVMISDNLGSPAIRRFYDPTGNAFDARTAAREAFFAGNDMLYVDRFVASGDPDMYTTIIRTMDYFTQKYREDAAFAQRVDASVERILTLKYRLYPNFKPEQVLPTESDLSNIGQSAPVTFEVARRAVTLISPDAADLPNSLPRPPEARDRVLFLTDSQQGRQCSTCPDTVMPEVDALQTAVLRLYGPRAGGQVSQNLMTSYSFMDLLKYINGYTTTNNEPLPIENDLKLADWVVVSMLKPNSSQPETMAFRRLLRERSDLLRNKKVVVFAFNAPYYLDATDISKLSAYYGMYSKTAPFVDVAARILFQELTASGALPVSVPGVGYDLIHATSPDPAQTIPLYIGALKTPVVPTKDATQEPTPVPIFRVGDVIPLHTGILYDHNHNTVPDGTPIRFVFSLISESSGSTQQQIDTETVDGMASATYRIERPGLLEIHAASEQGARTNLLRLDITSGVSVGATEVAPTSQPTETPTPTPTITATASPTATDVPPSIPTVHFKDWFFVLLVILGTAVGVSWYGIRQAITRWGLRWALCGVIGGMLFYNYVALGLPGSVALLRQAGTTGVVLVTIVGVFLGWMAGIAWRKFAPPAARQANERKGGEQPNSERSSTGPKSTGPKSQSS
jgi:beta-N-acetylhexosaminidase